MLRSATLNRPHINTHVIAQALEFTRIQTPSAVQGESERATIFQISIIKYLNKILRDTNRSETFVSLRFPLMEIDARSLMKGIIAVAIGNRQEDSFSVSKTRYPFQSFKA